VSTKLKTLVLAAMPLVLGGCSWLTDFRQQPSVGTWQSLTVDWSDTTTPFRGAPQGSVPTTGTAVAAYQISYSTSPLTIDSMSYLSNPVPATQESVDQGYKQYQVNCAVCHGEGAAGNGPALRFGVGAPNLLTTVTQGRTDGYLFGMLRNGRGLMPSMNRIPERDRWHIVNYVRALQGKLPSDIVAKTGAVGRPGDTGPTWPGYSELAPNRSIPFVKPVYVPSPGTGAAAEHGTTKSEGGH
jgi:mono/diheme cytochrome c family protein